MGYARKVEKLYRTVNVDATVQVADLSAQQGVQLLVFVSSVKAGVKAIANQCITGCSQGKPEGIYVNLFYI